MIITQRKEAVLHCPLEHVTSHQTIYSRLPDRDGAGGLQTAWSLLWLFGRVLCSSSERVCNHHACWLLITLLIYKLLVLQQKVHRQFSFLPGCRLAAGPNHTQLWHPSRTATRPIRVMKPRIVL